MSSNVPVTLGKVYWPGLLFQLAFIGGLYYVFFLLHFEVPFFFAAVSYALLARLLRSTIAKDHRKAFKLVRQKKYTEAIYFYERSYNYFIKHPWIDKYRFFTLLSAAKSSYTQMALNSIAFCYGQTGDGLKAISYYKKSLEIDPEDGLAQAGLNMLLAKHG